MLDLDGLVLGPCMAAFGEAVTFMPQRGPAQAGVVAVFEEHAKVSTFKDDIEVLEDRTMLGCQSSQFTGALPVANDEFEIRGVTYRAAEVVADGHGHLAIHVMLASDSQANIPQTPAWG